MRFRCRGCRGSFNYRRSETVTSFWLVGGGFEIAVFAMNDMRVVLAYRPVAREHGLHACHATSTSLQILPFLSLGVPNKIDRSYSVMIQITVLFRFSCSKLKYTAYFALMIYHEFSTQS